MELALVFVAVWGLVVLSNSLRRYNEEQFRLTQARDCKYIQPASVDGQALLIPDEVANMAEIHRQVKHNSKLSQEIRTHLRLYLYLYSQYQPITEDALTLRHSLDSIRQLLTWDEDQTHKREGKNKAARPPKNTLLNIVKIANYKMADKIADYALTKSYSVSPALSGEEIPGARNPQYTRYLECFSFADKARKLLADNDIDSLRALLDSLPRQAVALPAPRPARAAKPAPVPQPETPPPVDPLDGFIAQAKALLPKTADLPQSMAEDVRAIYDACLHIVECMRTDPADVTPGSRFLRRYLPLTAKLLDDHIYTSKSPVRGREIAALLERGPQRLAHMRDSYHKMHSALLRNDTMTMHAEMDVLDVYLKKMGL